MSSDSETHQLRGGSPVLQPLNDLENCPPQSNTRCLRVGILLEGTEVPAWVELCLQQVTELRHVEVAAVVLNAVPKSGRGILSRFWHHRRLIVWKLFQAIDRHFFQPSPDAFAPTDILPQLANRPFLVVTPKSSRFCDHFDAEAVREIRELQLDICLSFCHRILRGEILSVARQGVWSLHHADAEKFRGGPPGFWELAEGESTVGATLQCLSEQLDAGSVIDRIWTATDQTSLARTLNRLFWRSSQMMPRALARLCDPDGPCLNNPAQRQTYDRRLYRPPTNLPAARILAGHTFRALARRSLNLVRREQWQLLYFPGPDRPMEMRLMKTLRPPTDRLWADPMVIESNGKTFVFVEELLFAEGIGHISVMEYRPDTNSFSSPRPVLKRPYHLSYPHVFAADGEFWMIPECSANRTVELYRATSFPDQWELSAVIMENCDAVDATVFRHDGRWWMFVGLSTVNGTTPWEETHLFVADQLQTQEWKAHPANPICADVRRARPAGPIRQIEGKLFRPSQDCSVQYGYGLRIQEITQLSATEYRETEVDSIHPHWDSGLYGVHHISSSPGLTVMDVSVRCFRTLGSR